MNRYFSLRSAAVFAVLFISGNICQASGWTPELTITSAFTEESDLIVFYTSGGGAYTPNCAANSWMFQASTDPRRARAYATALAAIASGKKIQLWYSDVCGAWGFHQATAIKLVN